jgi:formylglycine-generating enzyme required for sulfatase activity
VEKNESAPSPELAVPFELPLLSLIMMSRLPILLLVAACLGWINPALATPVVTNLTAMQRTGTKLVDIAYDVAAPGFPSVTVSLEISSDAGATWTVPTTSASGHIGAGVIPGMGKAIVWDPGADWAGNYSTQIRFRVVADDGVFAPSGFAYIPGGSFTMGRTSGDTDSDSPPVSVTVSSFYMAKTETTKAQWDEVRMWGLSNGYADLAVGGGKAANHPVQMVNWWDVVKWCNARSEMEGLTPVYMNGPNVMRTGTTVPDVNWSANGHRLPSEAEWEKAARGGVEGKRFPWGTDTISHAQANYYGAIDYAYDLSPIYNYHPTYNDGTFPYTSPVGSFAANGFGLRDMSGNVWEWCWDRYAAGTYVDGATDPLGPASGASRVFRGGGWDEGAYSARASVRFGSIPASAHRFVGFRSARSRLISKFVQIPGGSFTMGRTSGDVDLNAPPIMVTVSPFYMAETETTKALWDEVWTWAVANGYTDLEAGAGKGANHPVHTVSWHNVVKWCNAWSEKEGLTPVYTVGGMVLRTGTMEPEANWTANGYRLPTEAEWEKAARGGVSGKRFPWGADTISHNEANFLNTGVEAYATGTTGSHPAYTYTTTGETPHTSPVGSFAANGHSMVDMAGNVWEWCWDQYGSSYYTTSSGTTDPRGPASGSSRVYRGGSWSDSAFSARCSNRVQATPGSWGHRLGFRAARGSVPKSDAGSATTGNVTTDTRSDNADLSALTLSSGTFQPTFAAGTAIYTDGVANTTTSIFVTPTRAQANATIDARVNGGDFTPVTSGSPSGALALNVGANIVEVRVTAEDTTTTKTYTITVTRDKASQTITFANPGDQPATATVNLSATGGASGNAVTFAVTSGPASISGGNVLTFTGAGSVTITASQAGDDNYDPATPVARTFTVSIVPQTITFSNPGSLFISEVLTLAATGGGSGSGVTYEVLAGPGVLANGNELSFTGRGNVTLRASQAGDDFHADADPVEQTFEVILPRPDVAVGAGPAGLVGVEVYTPGGQLVTLTSKKTRPVTGYLSLGNRVVLPDDRAADAVVLRGAGGNALFAVSYLGNEGNVTAGILTGTYQTAAMDGEDASVLLRAVVTPNKKKLVKKKGRRTVYLKKTFTSLFQANSKAWPPATDAAAIGVQTR